MSLAALRDRSKQRILEAAQQQLEILQGQAFRPASAINDTILPASTLEEIAVQTLTCNATIRALASANKIIDEEFKKLVDPHGDAPAADQEQGNDKEGIYG